MPNDEKNQANGDGKWAATDRSTFYFLILVGSVCGCMLMIGALHVSRLAIRLHYLEERVEHLEKIYVDFQEYNLTFEVGKNAASSNGVGGAAKIRSKRRSSDHEESEHRRAEHHGIASHHIALVHSDPADVMTISNSSDPSSPLYFREQSKSGCGSVDMQEMVNGNGVLWCKQKTNLSRLSDSMLFTKKNQNYNYFVKAKWMHRSRSLRNYNLTNDGRISVAYGGIYIIHASVFFSRVTNREDAHYGVYKTDGHGKNPMLMSQCTVPSNAQAESKEGVFPCQAWQLQHLKQGDQVFLRIGGYSWFRIEKQTFHLALIRLNTDQL